MTSDAVSFIAGCVIGGLVNLIFYTIGYSVGYRQASKDLTVGVKDAKGLKLK